MEHPIVYMDVSTVRAGRLHELKACMPHLATFVETNMPRVSSYALFLDESETRMTVVAVHPDSASLEFHLERGADEFRKFGGLVELERIVVFGDVSQAALDRMRAKAEMLGRGTVTVHRRQCGFAR